MLNYADVTTTATYTPMLPYPGIPGCHQPAERGAYAGVAMILGRDWKLAFCHEHLRPVLRAFRLGESGSSLIEFALSVSLLMMVVFGIMGLSLAAFSDHFVAIAAQAATRYASVRGSTWFST